VRDVDLLKDGGDCLVLAERAGHEHRPELAADAAFDEARDVGVGVGQPVGQVRALRIFPEMLAYHPRQVVMPVDEREPAEHGAGEGDGERGAIWGSHDVRA